MTVANNYAPIRQLGDSGTTQYSAAWSMIAAAYAVVELESVSTGVRTLLTEGVGSTQYQIAITGSGFTVTLGQPATNAFYVDVGRKTGLDQTNSYRTSKGFEGEVEENSFDKLTTMVQDAAYTAGQSLQIPSGETTATVMPSAALRAGRVLAFDGSGNVIVSDQTLATIEAPGSSATAAAASAAAALVSQNAAAASATTASTQAGNAGTSATAAAASATAAATSATNAANAAVTNAGGFVNKLRNAIMDVCQRGTSGTISSGSTGATLDGWLVSATGAAISWAQATTFALNSGGSAAHALTLTGNTSLTQAALSQRIESSLSSLLAGRTVTVQFQISNNTGSAIVPVLSTFYPSATDNWGSSSTDVSAVNLQSCPNGAITTVAYTFTPNANATKGYAVGLLFGTQLGSNAKSVTITAADLRATPGATLGLTSTPPQPEMRPLPTEQALCQRYFLALDSGGSGNAFSTSGVRIRFAFPTTMRVAPTAAQNGVLLVSNDVSIDATQSSTNIVGTGLGTSGGWVALGNFSGLTSGNSMGLTPNGSNVWFSSEL